MDEPVHGQRPTFSLAVLFATVTVIAFVLALMLRVRDDAASPALIALVPVSVALVITGVVFGSAKMRTFCIGAVIPLGVMLSCLTTHVPQVVLSLKGLAFDHRDEYSVLISNPFFGGGLLASLALGFLCVWFRWLIDGE